MCVGQRRNVRNPILSSLPHFPWGWELIRVSSQQAPGILLSPRPQHWGKKHPHKYGIQRLTEGSRVVSYQIHVLGTKCWCFGQYGELAYLWAISNSTSLVFLADRSVYSYFFPMKNLWNIHEISSYLYLFSHWPWTLYSRGGRPLAFPSKITGVPLHTALCTAG